MKRILPFIFLITCFCGIGMIAATDLIDFFKARSESSNVSVEWRSGNEDNVSGYDLLRASENGIFKKLANLEAKGNFSSYKYIDEETFLKAQTSDKPSETIQQATKYSYKLRIIFRNGNSQYTEPVEVSHNISSVRRTWGMLKELFR